MTFSKSLVISSATLNTLVLASKLFFDSIRATIDALKSTTSPPEETTGARAIPLIAVNASLGLPDFERFVRSTNQKIRLLHRL